MTTGPRLDLPSPVAGVICLLCGLHGTQQPPASSASSATIPAQQRVERVREKVCFVRDIRLRGMQ